MRDDDSGNPPQVPYSSLMRTSSLPTETDEELRKRKELQMLRRMEAERRRSEKQKNSRERTEGTLLEEEKQLGKASLAGWVPLSACPPGLLPQGRLVAEPMVGFHRGLRGRVLKGLGNLQVCPDLIKGLMQ